MSDLNSHNENPLEQLSEELVDGYLTGTLSEELRAKVEAYLAENPFEREALEGLAGRDSRSLRADLKELDGRLNTRTSKRLPSRIWWQMAAVIMLVAVSGLVIYLLLPDNESNTITIVQDSLEVSPPPQAPLKPESADEEEEKVNGTGSEKIMIDQELTRLERQRDNTNLISEEVESAHQNSQPEPGPNYRESDQDSRLSNTPSPAVEKKSSRPQEIQSPLPQELAYDEIPIPDSVRVVVGKVTHQQTGAPIMGVEILVEGTAISSTSDRNGFFHLEAPLSAGYLITQDARYVPEQVPLEEQPQINVLLETSSSGFAKERSPSITRAEAADSRQQPPPTAQPPPDMTEYLRQNLTYPEDARDHDVRGKVRLQFWVEPDGTLNDFAVLEKLGYGCEEEAIMNLQRGPAWQPAKVNGNKVRSKAEIEIAFPPSNRMKSD